MTAISAGAFIEWLEGFRASLLGNAGSDVPCGDCTGCCISGYSVQIRPHDRDARAAIPPELVVSALGVTRNELTMAARPDGTCPMLSGSQCTIYQDRPQTCRDYDCRVFAAAGLEAGGSDKAVINRRVRQWRFSYPTESDRNTHAAVMAAAAFIGGKRNSFPERRAPAGRMGISVLACETYAVFLRPDLEEKADEDVARLILDTSRDFHQRAAPRS
jgi:uncharacterized protein